MRRFTTILAILLIASLSGNAKLVMIDIKTVLHEAIGIKTIIVIGYNDTIMFYRFENSKDTLRINCANKKSSESFRLTLIERKMMKETDFAGKWPNVGQKVLIVINAKKRVSLFAFKVEDDYRFWDPNSIPFANSMFSIPKEKSFKPLKDCDNPFKNDNAKGWICSDGCLVTSLDVKER